MSIAEKMKERVAKLLRQAEDQEGTPEGETFRAKAFELMAKYGIETAVTEMLRRETGFSPSPDANRWEEPISGKYAAQQILLLTGIAQALHCKPAYTRLPDGSYVLYVFGVQRHLDRAGFLWSVLRPQMLRLVEKARPPYQASAGRVRSYRRAWIAGFAQTVSARLAAEEARALSADESGALVLYQDDGERAEVALKKAFPRTRQARRSSYDRFGYFHGQADGNQASIGAAIAG